MKKPGFWEMGSKGWRCILESENLLELPKYFKMFYVLVRINEIVHVKSLALVKWLFSLFFCARHPNSTPGDRNWMEKIRALPLRGPPSYVGKTEHKQT